jgi:hypothetical protein
VRVPRLLANRRTIRIIRAAACLALAAGSVGLVAVPAAACSTAVPCRCQLDESALYGAPDGFWVQYASATGSGSLVVTDNETTEQKVGGSSPSERAASGQALGGSRALRSRPSNRRCEPDWCHRDPQQDRGLTDHRGLTYPAPVWSPVQRRLRQ